MRDLLRRTGVSRTWGVSNRRMAITLLILSTVALLLDVIGPLHFAVIGTVIGLLTSEDGEIGA